MALAPMFMGGYRQQERQIVEVFLLICIVGALDSPVFLWWAGERKRAWQGFGVTLVVATIAAGLSAPMVFS